ncbi:hypothetical protein IAR55_000876 [Kwoniella newhampshirensis]|uniref:Uncharacterized protein n=1 Tax=Kwoniella newhampshirensis TaxID=1651941 RepID=A0AAW0Z476_9TREE
MNMSENASQQSSRPHTTISSFGPTLREREGGSGQDTRTTMTSGSSASIHGGRDEGIFNGRSLKLEGVFKHLVAIPDGAENNAYITSVTGTNVTNPS